MALPRPPEARAYYRAAKQRYEEARFLLRARMTTAAVYLAGYTVECIMKALIVANVAPGLRRQLLVSFRGRRAHDIDWLADMYRRHVGNVIPHAVTQHLSRVASWSTDIRYETAVVSSTSADVFLESVVAIMNWADERM